MRDCATYADLIERITAWAAAENDVEAAVIIGSRARTKHGWDYDTWFDGRLFDTWADQQVKEGIRTAFSHYNATDIVRALMASMDLFRTTARETADLMSFSYPQQEDLHTTNWVRQNIHLASLADDPDCNQS